MLSLVRGYGRFPIQAFALALGIWGFSDSHARADGHGHADYHEGRFGHGYLGEGTLGWAPYGLYPGLYGFSLRWHPGYGYGKYALGVGADGGYPFYGGFGYPHEWPRLRRFGPATPFAYYGGPPYPRDGCSNYYAGISGLVISKPIVTIGEPSELGSVNERGDVPYDRSFGPFTGHLPYPETLFAPYATEAAETGSYEEQGGARPSTTTPIIPPNPASSPPSASLSPADGELTRAHALAPVLGIDEEPVVDAGGVRGIEVGRVYRGGAAERSGLRAGDVIHSINGYLTTERGNVAWIIAVATPNNLLKMNVRSASDGKEHAILADLSIPPLNTERPSFLPPVGNGPPPASR